MPATPRARVSRTSSTTARRGSGCWRPSASWRSRSWSYSKTPNSCDAATLEYLLDLVPAETEGITAALAALWNAEADNVRAAFAWALQARHADLAQSLAGRRAQYGVPVRERVSWLDAALQLADRADPVVHARALADAAGAHYVVGDYDLVAELAQRSLDRFLALGDFSGQSLALRWLGIADLARGDCDRARERCERSLALARTGSTTDHRRAHALGECECDADNLDRAAALLEEALQLARDAGDTAHAAMIEQGLGDTALRSGDIAAAELYYWAALSSARELGMTIPTASCLAGLACVAAQRGERERAGHLWGASVAFMRTAGIKLHPRERLLYEQALATVAGPQVRARRNHSENRRARGGARTRARGRNAILLKAAAPACCLRGDHEATQESSSLGRESAPWRESAECASARALENT